LTTGITAARQNTSNFLNHGLPLLISGGLFFLLFWEPLATLVRDWWRDPEAGHGLLLGPLAVYLVWRRGRIDDAKGQPFLGLVVLAAAVLLRYASGLAAELFTMRFSMLAAAGALTITWLGLPQLVRWWLPALLLLLSIPIPAVVLNSLSFPLQFKASQMGAAFLEWRHVPVLLSGNVIHLPGQALFVTEACSGLRSLTALLALGVLTGGLWLRSPVFRIILVLTAIPVAMVVNGLRVFLTGFLVYFGSPSLGQGFMHYSEGWALFVVAFGILGVLTWVLFRIESWQQLRVSR
jgi:exosortase